MVSSAARRVPWLLCDVGDWAGPMEVALMATQLHAAGYRVASREENIWWEHGTEFNLIRMACPELGK
jgi:hypothetical protein